VEVEDSRVYYRVRETAQKPCGIHVIVLNEMTGHVMATNIFDTYSKGEDKELVAFVSNIKKQRIIIFTALVRAGFTDNQFCGFFIFRDGLLFWLVSFA